MEDFIEIFLNICVALGVIVSIGCMLYFLSKYILSNFFGKEKSNSLIKVYFTLFGFWNILYFFLANSSESANANFDDLHRCFTWFECPRISIRDTWIYIYWMPVFLIPLSYFLYKFLKNENVFSRIKKYLFRLEEADASQSSSNFNAEELAVEDLYEEVHYKNNTDVKPVMVKCLHCGERFLSNETKLIKQKGESDSEAVEVCKNWPQCDGNTWPVEE